MATTMTVETKLALFIIWISWLVDIKVEFALRAGDKLVQGEDSNPQGVTTSGF